VQETASKDGFEIEVKVFDDFVAPNRALADGDLDANLFQTKPYLTEIVQTEGFELEPLSPTITLPMAVYSDSLTSLDEVKKGAKVGLPNSATQEGRALLVLQDAGLITLPEGVGQEVTVNDVKENPYELEFILVDAAQLLLRLKDLDFAVVNSNYAIDAGYFPDDSALFVENSENLKQANYLVTRKEDADEEIFQEFLEYYQTEEVKQYLRQISWSSHSFLGLDPYETTLSWKGSFFTILNVI
jgi:D-methionine transport system substrate-binding protein